MASSDVRRLSYSTRYSSIPVLIKENTAEHQYYVAIYAMLIHRELNKIHHVFKDGSMGIIDAAILLHALTHDFSDMITGDMVRIFKYSSPEFTEAVHKAEDIMVSKLNEKLRELCKPDENWDWYVKSVVKAADFMSLYQYMWREKNAGNKEIEPFFRRMLKDMKMMQQKLLHERFSVSKDTTNIIYDKYTTALAALYEVMGNGRFQQTFVTS